MRRTSDKIARTFAARIYSRNRRAGYGRKEALRRAFEESNLLASSFRYWRGPNRFGRGPQMTAAAALDAARTDSDASKLRYPMAGTAYYNPPFTVGGFAGVRWVESPAAAGLRFVAYADDIPGARINHRGWYTDEFGDRETIRGVVFQMPGRDGRPIFVPGYDDQRNGRADAGGPVALAFGDTVIGEGGESDPARDGNAADAARLADQLAERLAESEREYNAAWGAGNYAAQIREEVAALRTEALEILADRRAYRGDVEFPAICRTIRARVAEIVDTIRDRRALVAKLADGRGDADGRSSFNRRDPQMVAAFNEGAGR